MEEFLKAYAPLFGAIVAFLVGYIRLKERVSASETLLSSLNKKLEEVESKMDKRDGEHYARLTKLEVDTGRADERNHGLAAKVDEMIRSLQEVRVVLMQGK